MTDMTKIFVALPSMGRRNDAQVAKLFQMANTAGCKIWIHLLSEKRHHDYARNMLAEYFLKSDCQWMLMLDDDLDPHPNVLKLADQRKDIIAGNVHAWIDGQLMPSIWQLAECEECRCGRIWLEERKVHDPSMYKETDDGEWLLRWNPFRQEWETFIPRDGEKYLPKPCRCRRTGFDPWVYRTHQSLVGDCGVIRCDSVGAACIMIRRRVIEEMKPPWFSFLYKPNRAILLTEDHYFCWKAQLNGFQVWADPNMVCPHFKTVNLVEVQSRLNYSSMRGMEHQKLIDSAKMAVEIPAMEEVAK